MIRVGATGVLAGIFWLWGLFGSGSAELVITASSEPMAPARDDPSVVAFCDQDDPGGTTSLRFVTDRAIDENKYPVDSAAVFGRSDRQQPQRDRDLGQTFLVGPSSGRLDAIYLRLGHSERFALEDALGAKVIVQWFHVAGSPRVNDHGTPGFLGRFDRQQSPELDDYLEGETYAPIRTVEGRLPARLDRGAYLKLEFRGDDRIELAAGSGYGFLLGFAEPQRDRALALANCYYGAYRPDPRNPYVGHGIRREGQPAFGDLETRLTAAPGTLGFPDVCTYRDLHFVVTLTGTSDNQPRPATAADEPLQSGPPAKDKPAAPG
jgi:hypothetical protein